jgi:PAS domain S-box-containing protein
MPHRNPPDPGGPLRRITSTAMVITFALVMTASVLGVMAWKALDAKKATLASGSADIQNLVHSLAEHASHTIQAVDIAMAGMVDLLKHRDPEPDRFNKYLAETAKTLPQLRGIGVADGKGNWTYSSFPETPRHNVSDRNYFAYHRDTPDNTLRISELLQSRIDDRSSMIVLSKRITKLDGSFGGVVAAAIDKDYFNGFYRTFQLGPDGGISLIRSDGTLLIRWPASDKTRDLSRTDLFSKHLKLSSVGYYKIISPFDGIVKHFGYEETPHYPAVVTVAVSEDWLLAEWRKGLRTDAIVAGVLLCMILMLSALLALQFRFRSKTERALREREAHYRLLANNIADIIILIDARSLLRYVSRSAEPVLGLRPKDILGKSCFDLVHPDDRESVKSATTRLNGVDSVSTVVFRHYRGDGTLAWVESKFKLASEPSDPARTEFLCVIRDVTERKRMEDELTQLNRRLTQPSHLRRLPAPRIRNLRRDCGAAVRYRQFQGLQRHLRTPGRRPLPAGGCESHRRCDRQYVRPVRALWRRGIRRGAAEHNGRRRPEGCREHPADGSGAGHSEHGLQPRIHHHQRGRRRQKPLDARRGRVGGGSRHRALSSQASRPQSQHPVFLSRPAICRERIHPARR